MGKWMEHGMGKWSKGLTPPIFVAPKKIEAYPPTSWYLVGLREKPGPFFVPPSENGKSRKVAKHLDLESQRLRPEIQGQGSNLFGGQATDAPWKLPLRNEEEDDDDKNTIPSVWAGEILICNWFINWIHYWCKFVYTWMQHTSPQLSGSGWGAEFGASSFWAIVGYRKNIANPQTGPYPLLERRVFHQVLLQDKLILQVLDFCWEKTGSCFCLGSTTQNWGKMVGMTQRPRVWPLGEGNAKPKMSQDFREIQKKLVVVEFEI